MIEKLSGEPDLARGSSLPLRETPLTPAGAGPCALGREGREEYLEERFLCGSPIRWE